MLINAAERSNVAKLATQRTTHMVRHLPITKARVNLGAVIRRVHLDKEYIILEKDGIPVAGLMNIDEFEDYLEMQDPKAKATIRKSSGEFRAGKARAADALLAVLKRESAAPRRKKTVRRTEKRRQRA